MMNNTFINNFKKLILCFLIANIAITAMAQQLKQKITIDDIWRNYTFYPKTVNGLNPMADGLHYTAILADTAIIKYKYSTGQPVQTLLTLTEINNQNINEFYDYSFSNDETKIIFYTKRKNIYRRSFTANYYVWDLNTKKLFNVSVNGPQQLATLSPNGKQVAFVRNNNIYIKTLETNNEVQITTDGQFNKIINGAPDWVYEEEFEYNQAFAWSPNGQHIAYCKFNEQNVPLFNMTMFAGLAPSIDKNKLYPENRTFKYPKAGDNNSIVTVHAYNIVSGQTQNINLGNQPDQYIPRIKWAPNGNIIIYSLNRLQNHLELLYANPQTTETNIFYSEKNNYYIDETFFDDLTFIDNNSFIYTSERDGYKHIYLYNINGKLIHQVTNGNFDVTQFLGYNPKTKTIFYQSAESSAINRDIYSIKTNGKNKTLLSGKQGTNNAVFSTGCQYFINYFTDANTPTIVTLHNSNGKLIRTLEDNNEFVTMLQNFEISKKEFFTFKTTQNIELNGYILKPVNFDTTKKYPVLITQYSGPNSQEVLNEFNINWEQVIAANNYIVVCTDGRGTGARGEQFRKITYKQLGKYETIDQIETAKYLGNLPYIDSNRIGIYGWSFGGFMALNCITQGAQYFKMAIAVAPVTNWRYYDNIYTERFMQKPQDNPEGYDNNSPINHAHKLKGKLLIVHGTADDNVHLQNSAEMSEALVQANKQFDQFYYTNRNHGIYGGNTRYHLFTMMVKYVTDNL